MSAAEFALVLTDGTISQISWIEGLPPPLAPNKGRWLPVVSVDVLFGTYTEVLVGPTLAVENTRVTRSWSVRQRTSEEVSADVIEKMAAITVQFNLRTQAPITIGTHLSGLQTFDLDNIARQRIMAVLIMIAVAGSAFPPTRPWTPSGSLSPVTMTPTDFVTLLMAGAQREDVLFVRKKMLESNLIGMSGDSEAIAAFDASIGWD